MRLYLIRHAESANNAALSSGGGAHDRVPDPDITDKGHRQAELLATHLADPQGEPRHHPHAAQGDAHQRFDLTHLYCSLMSRSILTADYVARTCGLKAVAHPDIFENGGIYELSNSGEPRGLPGPGREYFEERFPSLELGSTVDENGWYNRPFETITTFVERTRSAVDDILARHEQTDDCVAMVVHGDFIDQFVNEIVGLGRRLENYRAPWAANWAMHNTSLSRIDFVAGSRTVVYLNRVEHLPAELVTW